MTGHRRTGRVSRGLLGAALAAGVLLGGASTATADVVLHVVPNLPADLVVGQTGAASTITITNASDGPETWADVAVETITLVASCGTRQINGADCPGAAVDPGILKPSATATGQAGTACSGIAFTTSLIDPTEGVYAFAPAAPVVLGPGGSQTQTCVLDFTVTVPKAPVIDAAPTLAGLQTDQVAFARARAGLLVAGSADATSEVTVTPAAVSLATQVAPASITAGQAFEDTATLTAPPAGVAPTGTIGFAVYGPADPTCADQPVFTSTNQLAGSSTVSDPFTPTSPGTYRVIAGYSGDADYAAAASACGDPTEAVTVTGLPAVSGLGPAGGPESGGTQVTISGTNLSGATAVHFGGATVTPSTVSATDVSAAAPAGVGTVDVSVTTPAGTSPSVAADRYAYAASDPPINPPGSPAVSGLIPAGGPESGGTQVTISGTNLSGATAVHFGGATVTPSTVSATDVSAAAPAGVGTVDVSVTTPAGTSPSVAADRYAYAASPPPINPPTSPPTTPPSALPTSPPPTGPPASQTGPPVVVTTLSAELTATVNPQGLATTAHFEYTLVLPATSRALTLTARTPEQSVGADFANHTVTASVASLQPNSRYRVRVVATNSSGATAGRETAFDTAADPPPPPPVLDRTFNAAPVSGVVYVRLPGGAVEPLTDARQLPVGTTFDTRRGMVELTTATQKPGSDRHGSFGGGRFRLLQSRAAGDLTELQLILDSTARRVCATATAAARVPTRAKRALPRTDLALLHSSVKGRFETRGRYSSATVRGTVWTTADRCDGTLTIVHRGVVEVDDLARRHKVAVRAGHSYLARVP